MLSIAEERVLRTFQQFLMTPGKMLCLYGPTLTNHKKGLDLLTEKKLLVAERFKGGYSLTEAGYAVMNDRR